LQGRKVAVTAGGTQEPLDPVRVLTNRSSGKQGFALAQAALDAGAEVLLITGPVALPTPGGANLIRVETASDMEQAVLEACQEADVLLMAAAVADFRPAQIATQKIKKQEGLPWINLEPTPDILAAVAERRRKSHKPDVVVGFAAETKELIENARSKLHTKQLDLIVANDVSAADSGFAVDTNRVTLLKSSGEVESLPLMSKAEVAERIIGEVASILLKSG
jgi:phosphopantothenoylcysteine decarboxylase/phosphopantothenate--cysteine ligase